MKITHYKKENNFSYTLGFYPTIELLKYKSNKIIKIIYESKALKSSAWEILANLCKEKNITLEEDDKTIDRLSNKDNTYIIGLFKKYDSSLELNKNHVVLYRPSDIGNVGMIIRSCLGLGVEDIVIISPSVDIFNPKVIRATMGAFFNINFEYFDSIENYLEKFKNNVYLFDIKGAVSMSEVKFKVPYSLIFGNEGSGLPDSILKRGEVVKIEQTSKVESLNLANSVSIALYWAKINN